MMSGAKGFSNGLLNPRCAPPVALQLCRPRRNRSEIGVWLVHSSAAASALSTRTTSAGPSTR
jgi:hypothetical protein